MNYQTMSDFEINRAVTCELFGCHQWAVNRLGSFYHCGPDGSGYYEVTIDNYCNDPSHAWSIIIGMIADGCIVQILKAGVIVTLQEGGRVQFMDENPLRAAMIVFLMMQEQKS